MTESESPESPTKVEISSNLEKILWQINTLDTKELPDEVKDLTKDISELKSKTVHSIELLKDLRNVSEQYEKQLNELHDWIVDNDFHKITEGSATTTQFETILVKLKENYKWLVTVESKEPHILESVEKLKILLQIQMSEYAQLPERMQDQNKVSDSKDMSVQTSMEYIPVPDLASRETTSVPTDNICISQTITDDGKETICISNIPNLQSPNEDFQSKKVIIQAIYKPGECTGRHTEIFLSNIPKTFETTVIEPDFTQTDIKVDEMGNKTVTVQKLTQSVQYSLQTTGPIVESSKNNVDPKIEAIFSEQELSQDAQQVHLENKIAPVVDNISVVDNTSQFMPNLIDEIIDDPTNVQIAECIKEQEQEKEYESLVNVEDTNIWPQTFDTTDDVYAVKSLTDVHISENSEHSNNNEQQIWPLNTKTGFSSPENYFYDFDVTIGQSDQEELVPNIEVIETKCIQAGKVEMVADKEKNPTDTREDEIKKQTEEKLLESETSEKRKSIIRDNIQAEKETAGEDLTTHSGHFSISLQVDPNEIDKVQLNLFEIKETENVNLKKQVELSQTEPKFDTHKKTPDESIAVTEELQTPESEILIEEIIEICDEPIHELESLESSDLVIESEEVPKTMETKKLADEPCVSKHKVDDSIRFSSSEEDLVIESEEVPKTMETKNLADEPSVVEHNVDESIRFSSSEEDDANILVDPTIQETPGSDKIVTVSEEAFKLIEYFTEEPVSDVQNKEKTQDTQTSNVIDTQFVKSQVTCELETEQEPSEGPPPSDLATVILETSDPHSIETQERSRTESSESVNKSEGSKKTKKKKKKKKLHQTPVETDVEKTTGETTKKPDFDINEEQIYTLSSDDTCQSLSEIVEDKIKVVEFSGIEAIDDMENEMHSQIVLPVSVIEGVETVDELQQTDAIEEIVSHSEAPVTTQSLVPTESKDMQTITIDSKEIGSQTTVTEKSNQNVQTLMVEYSEIEMQTIEFFEPTTEHPTLVTMQKQLELTDHDTQTEVVITKNSEIQMEIQQGIEQVEIKPANVYCTEDIVNPLITNIIGKVIDRSFESQQNTGTLENRNLGTQTFNITEEASLEEVNTQFRQSMQQVQSSETEFNICEVDVITDLKLIPSNTDDTNVTVQCYEFSQKLDLPEQVSLTGMENQDLSICLSVLEDDIPDAVDEPLSMLSECSHSTSRSHSSIVDKALNLAAINHAYKNLSKTESQSSLEERINLWVLFIIQLKKTGESASKIRELEDGLKDILKEVQNKAQEIDYKIEFTMSSRSGLDFDADISKLMLISNELNEYRLKTILKIKQEIIPSMPNSENFKQYLDSASEKYSHLERSIAVNIIDLKNRKMRWSTINSNIIEIKSIAEVANIEANKAITSDLPLEEKLDELDILELQINAQITKLILVLKTIKQFSTEIGYHVEVPSDFYLVYEKSKMLQNNINLEKSRIISFLGLADEYEQTLEEFSKILIVATNLIESHLTVGSLEQLQEEVQKHRKFFININHCRSILESLESNLDVRTKTKNKTKHNICYAQATEILEKASDRFQNLALATSKLTSMEREVKSETQWLMVAQQRLPDLSTVTSTDFEQFITFYRSFSKDTASHYSKLMKINDGANRLQSLVCSEFIVKSSQKLLLEIIQLREETTLLLNKLQGFGEFWNLYNGQIDKLESWMLRTERQLALINVPSDLTKEPVEKMREFWEIRAQFEVYNVVYNEAGCFFEDALKYLHISDDSLQRQYNSQFSERWRLMSENIANIQKKITNGVTDALIPAEDKLQILRDELVELKQSLAVSNKEVLKNQDELCLHIERLEVFKYRVTFLGSELGKIGLLSSVDSNTITDLFAITRLLSLGVEEDLELANLMQERLHTINTGINQVERAQSRLDDHLNECKNTEKCDSPSIEKALGDLYAIQSDLSQQWTEIMHLRQLLHTLPANSTNKVFVSPVQLERSLAAIQDQHVSLEKKFEYVFGLLRERLSHWKRFEQQIEIINQYINETEYMIDILTVHDHVDLKRLSQATNRLQDLQNDFSGRQVAVDELKNLAQPLIINSVVEISKHLQSTIEQTVTNWTSTKNKVTNLCDKYQKAIDLWKQYRDCASVVDCWLEEANDKLENVVSGDGRHEQIGVTTNFDGCKDKLVELDGLVIEISQLLQMNAPPSKLKGKIDQLKSKFENTQEFIVSLEKLDPRILRTNNLEQKVEDVLKNLKTEIENISTSFVPNVENEKIDDLQKTLFYLSTSCVGKVEDVQRADTSIHGSSSGADTQDEKNEILNLWQNLFVEIYHKYQKRFTELLPSDTKGLVDFWTNYLTYIGNLLDAKVPAFYSDLIEEKRLLEIHRTLLTNQTRIFNQYLSDFANENSILVIQQAEANKALDDIHARIALTNERLEKYDLYQKNRYALLEWFKTFETAKSELQLRNLNLKRIPKVINEIEQLIGQIETVGENHMATLATNQNELMIGHTDDVLSSLKIENIAFRQRISNLGASLNTWREFLQSIILTGANYEELLQRIQQIHDRHTGILSAFEANIAANKELSEAEAHQLQHHIDELNSNQDIVRLEQSYQQLQQCMNLGQARNQGQIVWMLHQKRLDLVHEYEKLQCSIGENDNLRTSFFMVCLQFCEWMAKTQEKLLIVHPFTDIMCHKTNYLEAINVRENEYAWIFQTGNELMNLFKQNPKLCAEIQEQLNQVSESWSSLKELYDSQYTVSPMSLISSPSDESDSKLTTIHTLEIRINQIREWLIAKQKQICLPFRFEHMNDAEFNDYILEQESLQKSLEQESGGIGEVLNLCEMICATDEYVSKRTSLKMLHQSMKNLDRRWKSICFLLPNRKKNLFSIWRSLKKIQKLQKENLSDSWLHQQKKVLNVICQSCDKMSHESLKDLEVRIKDWLDHLNSVGDVVHQLKYSSQDLLTSQFIHIETDSSVSKLLELATTSIKMWRDLLAEGEGIEKRIQSYSLIYSEFVTGYRDLMMQLSDLKVEVSNLKFSQHNGSMHEKDVDDEETFKNFQKRLLNYQESVIAVERFYEEQLKPLASDIENVELKENLNEMFRLSLEIKNDLKSSRSRALFVDESTQVNTLYIATAVQVDTLNYVDSTYKHELYAAYSELSEHIGRLVETADGDDANGWPKLLSKCESSLELCKHLCHVLIRDYPEFAECEKKLISKLLTEEDRFHECLEKWRCNQQKEKCHIETSDTGEEICVYCATLDWQAADNDLWRLEQWLQYAIKTQQTYDFKALPTYSIEQLEDIIQEHREFLLDLDSHKIIVATLTTINEHLRLHRQKKQEQIPRFREKLKKCIAQWDDIYGGETAWQQQLHKNLLSNDEFYNIIDDQTRWLRDSELRIRQLYPPELTQEVNLEDHPPLEYGQRQLYEEKLKNLQDMRQELDQCEPRILNLQEVTKQLFVADVENRDSKLFYERLTKLKIGLHALQKVTNLYIIRLAIYLGYGMDQLHSTEYVAAGSLHNLSNLLLESTAAQQVENHPAASAITSSTSLKTARSQELTQKDTEDDTVDGAEAQRRSRVRRIMRASIPIQGVLLLLLGAMAILPQGQDYVCSLVNNFARSFEPMLSWRGPGDVPF